MWLEAKFKIRTDEIESFETLLLMNDIESWEITGEEALRQMDGNYDYINSELEEQPDNIVKIILPDEEESKLLLASLEISSGISADSVSIFASDSVT